jgi:hypothetical protein
MQWWEAGDQPPELWQGDNVVSIIVIVIVGGAVLSP